jgi:pimeloyl-ACP methyl ester carboxylesterase
MLVDLVQTTTPDGMRLDGALHAAATTTDAPFDLAICLHGVQSNFYSSRVIEAMVEPLTSQGVAVLRVNTRGHDSITAASTGAGRRWQGAAFEIVDECRLDVQGWLAWAERRGFKRVLLLGHSLGAVKCLYAATHEDLPAVRGIVAISPPRLSYSHFRSGFDNDKFFESIAAAESFFEQRRPDSLFQAKFPVPLFITGTGYLDKYGPSERYNFVRFLHRVGPPLLLTYGGKELEASPAFIGVREAIAAAPKQPRALSLVTIDNADHIYTGQHAPLASAVTEWVSRIRSSS